MARPLRIAFRGALYHLTAWGNARQNIFLDDEDRQRAQEGPQNQRFWLSGFVSLFTDLCYEEHIPTVRSKPCC